MFKFYYLIYDNMKEKLKNITLEEFEEDYKDFYGAFELTINGNKFNEIVKYEDQNFKNIEEKREFEKLFCLQDSISFWIIRFLELAMDLNNNDYIAIRDIGSSIWLEFKKKGNQLYISEIFERENDNDISEIKVYKKINEKNNNYIVFKNEKINFDEFITEIKKISQKFIEDIENLNNFLLKSEEMKRIIKNYKILKNIRI